MKLWCYGQRRDAPDEQIAALRRDFQTNHSAHDCGEWVTAEHTCAICDHPLPPDFFRRP